MDTIVFAAQKGGCGKTTLAVHLAVEYGKQGKAVALLDTDPQQSAAMWGGLRETDDLTVAAVPADQIGAALRDAESDGYDLVIVDTPPHASASLMLALRKATLAVLPFRPTPFDLATLQTVKAMIDSAAIPAVAVISLARLRGAEINPMRRAIEESGLMVLETVIHDLMPFSRSTGDGLSVTEFDPKGRAALEIHALRRDIDEVISLLRNEVITP